MRPNAMGAGHGAFIPSVQWGQVRKELGGEVCIGKEEMDECVGRLGP